jgi:hypothetical protein
MAKQKKAKTEEVTEPKITGEQTEKMLLLYDQIEYKGQTLYDLIFHSESMVDVFMTYTPKKKADYEADTLKLSQADPKSALYRKLSDEMNFKYSDLYKPQVAMIFKATKFLHMNPAKTKELAKVFSHKDLSIMEATEVCLESIRFLKDN